VAHFDSIPFCYIGDYCARSYFNINIDAKLRPPSSHGLTRMIYAIEVWREGGGGLLGRSYREGVHIGYWVGFGGM